MAAEENPGICVSRRGNSVLPQDLYKMHKKAAEFL